MRCAETVGPRKNGPEVYPKSHNLGWGLHSSSTRPTNIPWMAGHDWSPSHLLEGPCRLHEGTILNCVSPGSETWLSIVFALRDPSGYCYIFGSALRQTAGHGVQRRPTLRSCPTFCQRFSCNEVINNIQCRLALDQLIEGTEVIVEPFTWVYNINYGVTPHTGALSICPVVPRCGTQDHNVMEDSKIGALKEVQGETVFPHPVCLQMIVEWGLFGSHTIGVFVPMALPVLGEQQQWPQ